MYKYFVRVGRFSTVIEEYLKIVADLVEFDNNRVSFYVKHPEIKGLRVLICSYPSQITEIYKIKTNICKD